MVYAVEISRLISETFPDYGKAAMAKEKFHHFLAGLKCQEQGATDMVVTERCENAKDVVKQDYAPKTITGGPSAAARSGGQIAFVQKVTDYGDLYKAVHSLAEELKECK